MHTKKRADQAQKEHDMTCCFVISRSAVRVREVAHINRGTCEAPSALNRDPQDPTAPPQGAHRTTHSEPCPHTGVYTLANAVQSYLDDVTPSKAGVTRRHDHLYARRVTDQLGALPVSVIAPRHARAAARAAETELAFQGEEEVEP